MAGHTVKVDATNVKSDWLNNNQRALMSACNVKPMGVMKLYCKFVLWLLSPVIEDLKARSSVVVFLGDVKYPGILNESLRKD